ncbi:LOW QUALITY PROTEIN: uncharacterized protein LOC124448617 [Xenia sp. Carnegie-2017]|uniref:LOW QUALITY PROTEIN: uncharacterized protein LOC124448617 n=1 Tax=Xenia sp. Carnegie-2017 TaxID=2897299 RepID=UPI001F043628|nr:LOW QUALITY PROTEIN: uncharacterized protein LOC124448617 [Xenia sp. Carnegie-2017]
MVSTVILVTTIVMMINNIVNVNAKSSLYTAADRCLASQNRMYRVTLQICDKGFWKPAVTLPKGSPKGESCLDILQKGSRHGSGEYLIAPKGQSAFKVYCDMDSFGGGWTMCYKTDNFVNLKNELKSTPRLGYRADCNHIPFNSVMFVDEKSTAKAAFTRDVSTKITINDSYDKNANAFGLWTAKGVASSSYKYQLLVCNTSFYKGLMVSGYTGSCYKRCDHWCGDTVSPYFRSASSSKIAGVAFNENGHKPVAKRLISVAIR